MTETTARIRWEDSRDGTETLGWVGTFGRAMFRIWPPDVNGERILLAYLAGEAQHMYHDDTADALSTLKAKAEGLLTEFAASLGAVFPDSPHEPREALRALRCVQAGWAFGVPEDGREQWLDLVAAAMANPEAIITGALGGTEATDGI